MNSVVCFVNNYLLGSELVGGYWCYLFYKKWNVKLWFYIVFCFCESMRLYVVCSDVN